MQTTQSKINFSIKTDAYQGPFELLLDLIETRKLLVNDLTLSNITEDFIQHVRAQSAFPVEETANFIQIAATLLLIKSKSLIPDLALTDEETADVEDLKRRLEAYEKVREAARELSHIFGKTPMAPAGERAPEVVFAPSRDLSAHALAEALARMGANIQLHKECLGSKACRYKNKNQRHSAVIVGPTPLVAANIDIPDLRAGFSYLIAALIAQGTSKITGIEHVERGYENILGKLRRLGAKVKVT